MKADKPMGAHAGEVPSEHLSTRVRLLGATLGLAVLIWTTARAQEHPSVKEPPRPHVDLILIVDTSQSMVGVGKGSANIFKQVKEAAKQLIDWTQVGDNVVFVSYDERINIRPTIAVNGEREKDYLKQQIDALKAPGKWTYTAAAIRDSVDEAVRLHQVQMADPAGPHTKLVVLLTDGINDPPPYVKAGEVLLPEVAKRLSDMPWFVWQVQLGAQVDEDVQRSFTAVDPTRTITVHEPEAKKLLAGLRQLIGDEMAKRFRRAAVRFEPTSLEFGTVQAGTRSEQAVKLIAEPAGPIGRIRLQAAGTPADVRVTFTPEELSIGSDGIGRTNLAVEVGASLAAGQLAGVIAGAVTEGALDMRQPTLTWSATVMPQTHAVRIEPATLSFATLRPGKRETKDIALVADAGHKGGRVRVRPETLPEGVHIAVEPEEVTLAAGKTGQAKVTFEITQEASKGARSGQLTAQVTGGALELKTPVISWSGIVDWPALQFAPGTLDFGSVKPGSRETKEVKLRGATGDAAGKVRLRAEGVSPGVRITVAPEEITLQGGEGHTQVSVEADSSAATGPTQGRLVAQVMEGPLELQTREVAWSATIKPPSNPIRVALAVGGAVVLLAVALLGIREARKPKLHGELRYWKEGTGTMETVSLDGFGKRSIRVAGASESAIVLPETQGEGLTIRPAKRDGRDVCVAQPDEGSRLQFEGHDVTELQLFNQDEFTFAGYCFEYRGNVPTRIEQS